MIYQPDTQQDVYHYFLDDLKTAVGILENYVNLAGYTPEFSRFDLLLDGKVESWIRFANSLRLRLAIRMAMADPDKARQEFADALADPLGVFEEPTQLVAVTTDEEYSNPLGEINRVWGEVYMNASMESILNGFDDPRREAFFEPCPDDVLLPDRDGRDSVLIPLKGQYRGIRQRTMFAHTLYSALSKIYVNVPVSYTHLMPQPKILSRIHIGYRNGSRAGINVCGLLLLSR